MSLSVNSEEAEDAKELVSKFLKGQFQKCRGSLPKVKSLSQYDRRLSENAARLNFKEKRQKLSTTSLPDDFSTSERSFSKKQSYRKLANFFKRNPKNLQSKHSILPIPKPQTSGQRIEKQVFSSPTHSTITRESFDECYPACNILFEEYADAIIDSCLCEPESYLGVSETQQFLKCDFNGNGKSTKKCSQNGKKKCRSCRPRYLSNVVRKPIHCTHHFDKAGQRSILLASKTSTSKITKQISNNRNAVNNVVLFPRHKIVGLNFSVSKNRNNVSSINPPLKKCYRQSSLTEVDKEQTANNQSSKFYLNDSFRDENHIQTNAASPTRSATKRTKLNSTGIKKTKTSKLIKLRDLNVRSVQPSTLRETPKSMDRSKMSSWRRNRSIFPEESKRTSTFDFKLGDCTWSNMNGMKVDLGSTRLQSLSELESDALQKVSLSRLQDADLGVNIVVPKDESKILKRKVSMKKKYGVHLSSKDKNKDKNYDHVFGIPLVNVVENDQLLRLQKSASFANSLEYQSPEAVNESSVNPGVIALASSLSSSSSSCSGSSSSIHHQPSQFNNLDEVEGLLLTKPTTKTNLVENLANDECVPTLEANDSDNVFNNTGNGSPHQLPTPNSAKSNSSTAAQPLRRRGAIAADSINELDKNQTSLLQALSLSMTGTTNQRKEKTRSLLPPTMPSVPYVVQKCCDHIKKYGLHVTGIFRIAGSKKRVKQLREEFDRGMDVTIEEDYNPHDVAALLKEFFRDLPEALLTRELYPALIQTAKQVKQERLCNLRYLVWLLPLSNRDTLHTLLNFLALVATHSETSVDRSGQQVPGNKMNISNLATIFGPNILHRHKKSSQTTTDGPYQVQSLEKPEDSSSVIKVVEDLITYQAQLFQIPKEDHNDMLRTLKETDPEAVDFLLRRKAANHMREKSHLLNNSCSPTTSKSDDQSGPMDSKANVSSQSEQIEPSNVCEAKQEDPIMSHLNNNTNEGDAPRVYSSMRLSYQQATGHAFPPAQAEKTDLTTKLKFIRPIFKKAYQQPKSRTNPSDAEASYNYTPCEMDYQETNSIAESSLDRRESTGSFLSINTKARSMSFTDDDLQQIFGQKNGQKSRRRSPMIPSIQEFRCSDEYCDNTDSEPTFQRATEVDGEKFEHAKCTENKIYFMKNETSSSIKLSDTKSSVDCTEGDVSSSEVAKRRGGFSVQPQMKREHIELATSVRNDSETKRSPSTRQRRFRRLKKEQDSQLSADNVLFVSSQVDAYATGTGVVSNSAAQNDDTKELSESRLKTNKDKFNFITTMHIPVASRSDYNNNNSNNNNSNETYKSQKCQVLKLRPSTISTINVVLSPGTKDNGNITYQTNSPFLTSNPATNESSLNGASVPKPSPRRRLQNSLSPRIQRQYKPASSLTLKHNLHSENFSQHKLSENQTRGGDRDVKLQSAVTTYTSNPNTKGCEAWKTTKDVSYAQKFSTANNAQDNDSVAETKSFPLKNNSVSYLARRYSKDDLALTKDSKHAPGSRWTSAGLLGTAESNHSACLPHHITKEENKLNSNSNKEQMTWHDIFRDKQHLPETLV